MLEINKLQSQRFDKEIWDKMNDQDQITPYFQEKFKSRLAAPICSCFSIDVETIEFDTIFQEFFRSQHYNSLRDGAVIKLVLNAANEEKSYFVG